METDADARKRIETSTLAAVVRIAKRASRISKKKLVENTIWDLGSRGPPGPEVMASALKELVETGYLKYDKTTGIFTYVP